MVLRVAMKGPCQRDPVCVQHCYGCHRSKGRLGNLHGRAKNLEAFSVQRIGAKLYGSALDRQASKR